MELSQQSTPSPDPWVYEPTPSQEANLRNNFVYHAPFGTQQARYVYLRDRAGSLANCMNRCCPPSRELSVAMTKLEEAIFWANAAIARNETNTSQDAQAK